MVTSRCQALECRELIPKDSFFSYVEPSSNQIFYLCNKCFSKILLRDKLTKEINAMLQNTTQQSFFHLTSSKWDLRFLRLAEHISAWSKDPSTQCGAIIARGNRIISLGFNGLPQGIPDSEEYLQDRELKLQTILHAETNAILFARCNLEGCTIYTWPFLSCCRCAAVIIQSGLKRVVTKPPSKELKERWAKELKIARELYNHAGVKVEEVFLD